MACLCKICLYAYNEDDDNRRLMYFCVALSSLLDLHHLAQSVFPRLNLKLDRESVVCASCIHMLTKLALFKDRCFKTEEMIRMYKRKFDIDKMSPISLWGPANYTTLSEHEWKICRTCLQIITKKELTSELGTARHVEFLRNCIKEVYIHPIIDPVLCPECAELTELMYYYFQVCSHNQNKLYDIERLESGRSC